MVRELLSPPCSACSVGGYPPVLFVVTFSLALSVSFAIWFSKCRSRFCNMSSCCRRSRMAFLGASFLFCADCPPNQVPHILPVSLGSKSLNPWSCVSSSSTQHLAVRCTFRDRREVRAKSHSRAYPRWLPLRALSSTCSVDSSWF